METETLPAHITFDKQGGIENIVILNPKTRAIEFFSASKKNFTDIGDFIGTITKEVIK